MERGRAQEGLRGGSTGGRSGRPDRAVADPIPRDPPPEPTPDRPYVGLQTGSGYPSPIGLRPTAPRIKLPSGGSCPISASDAGGALTADNPGDGACAFYPRCPCRVHPHFRRGSFDMPVDTIIIDRPTTKMR